MEAWQIVLVAVLVSAAVLGLGGWLLWRAASERSRSIARRIQRLPWQSKLTLARRLMADDRIPRRVRLTLAGLALYLAMPLDIIPDFVPVLGQLDDLVLIVIGVAFIVHSIPMPLLESHIESLETP